MSKLFDPVRVGRYTYGSHFRAYGLRGGPR